MPDVAMPAFGRYRERVRSALRRASAAARPVIRFQLAYRTGPLIALWILLVLYPNPFNLGASVYRVFNPDIDPAAVEPLLEGLPSDPLEIEIELLQRIPYRYDWETHRMPWYFPPTSKVVERGEGDCKARAVVVASVFENLGIPYRFNSSFVHIWVEYDEKAPSRFENPEAKFYQQDPETGERLFQLPDVQWRLWFDSTKEGLWDVMPVSRKALLFLGTALLVIARVHLRRNVSKGRLFVKVCGKRQGVG